MLGKNRIQNVCSLESLQNLDVLDLHSNNVSRIQGLGALTKLRVLNFAGNLIQKVIRCGKV